MAGPATFRASNSVLGTLFTSDNSLFIQLQNKETFLSLYYYLINIVNLFEFELLLQKLHIAPLREYQPVRCRSMNTSVCMNSFHELLTTFNTSASYEFFRRRRSRAPHNQSHLDT